MLSLFKHFFLPLFRHVISLRYRVSFSRETWCKPVNNVVGSIADMEFAQIKLNLTVEMYCTFQEYRVITTARIYRNSMLSNEISGSIYLLDESLLLEIR